MDNGLVPPAPPAPPPRKRLTIFGKAARTQRIFARVRQGWAYDEVAREERLSPKRVRQIVSEVLQRREIDDCSEHAQMQLARLQPLLKVAAEAVANGDVRAIAPALRVLDRLDRYQQAASVTRRDEEEIRGKLLAKLNRLAEAQSERYGPDREAEERASFEAGTQEKIPMGFVANP